VLRLPVISQKSFFSDGCGPPFLDLPHPQSRPLFTRLGAPSRKLSHQWVRGGCASPRGRLGRRTPINVDARTILIFGFLHAP
jgi:hypothetical protein